MNSTAMEKIIPALIAVQAELDPARQDGENPHYKSKYATLESIWASAHPALAKQKMAVVSGTECPEGRSPIFFMLLLHESGQFIRSEMPLAVAKQDPQGIGSAITYFRRYLLASMLGIIQADDDGNAATGKPSGAPKAPPARPATAAKSEGDDGKSKFEKAQKMLNDAKTVESVMKIAIRIENELGGLPAAQQETLRKLAGIRKKALGGK